MKLDRQPMSCVGGLCALAVMAGLTESQARAQAVVAPGPVYTRPYVYIAPRTNAGVLPGFAPRGGIGTTPFLGNTRGLGAYSHNFDNDYLRTTTPTRTTFRRWNRRVR